MTRSSSESKAGKEQKSIYLSTSTSPTSNAALAKKEIESLRIAMCSFTSIRGVTSCGMKLLLVKVSLGKREVVEVTDHCKNKHVCPSCMNYQYWKFGKRLGVAIGSWLDLGGAVFTQTLTLPNRNKKLIYKHEDLARVWTAMGKTKRYSSLKRKSGMKQSLRVLEDVLGIKYSFPHFHLTWFFQERLQIQEMEAFSREVAQLWQLSADKCGVRGVQSVQQWSGPIQSSITGYCNYLFKHGYFDLNFQPKDPGNSNRGLKPLDYLRVLVATGDYEMLKTWLDYEQATSHRHRIQPSKGFQWGKE
ncbi:hypothetical protein [Candidatus Aquiluna sp. UB-MaderosW2red]|uniref:hypothetical protein n=1 Tax=Candidatus Aquiluna sp. UB-MaderosW2red TaxID=1855377 RepID=UPI000875D3A8|nr:hypothetical protein [Candidatus Aquiluna sp. UB-MaderosW2red]SCX08393.1 hypothetical protein SAMN05216534_0772 [Candidatus Aquiluna sp. UB-MaderosW2red]